MNGLGARLERVSGRSWLIGLLAVALLLRLPLTLVEFDRVADEIWQYLEPAHRLLTGHGIVTWEYRAGMRSWLIPTLAVGPLWVGRLLFGESGQAMVPLRVLLALSSLLLVWAAFRIGDRVSRLHAVVAELVMATAFEPILKAARAMSEAIGTVFLFAATVPLLDRTTGRGRHLLLGGLLLGLAVAARLQFGAAAATSALFGYGVNWRKWGWVVGGGTSAHQLPAEHDRPSHADEDDGRKQAGKAVEGVAERGVLACRKHFGQRAPQADFRHLVTIEVALPIGVNDSYGLHFVDVRHAVLRRA